MKVMLNSCESDFLTTRAEREFEVAAAEEESFPCLLAVCVLHTVHKPGITRRCRIIRRMVNTYSGRLSARLSSPMFATTIRTIELLFLPPQRVGRRARTFIHVCA